MRVGLTIGFLGLIAAATGCERRSAANSHAPGLEGISHVVTAKCESSKRVSNSDKGQLKECELYLVKNLFAKASHIFYALHRLDRNEKTLKLISDLDTNMRIVWKDHDKGTGAMVSGQDPLHQILIAGENNPKMHEAIYELTKLSEDGYDLIETGTRNGSYPFIGYDGIMMAIKEQSEMILSKSKIEPYRMTWIIKGNQGLEEFIQQVNRYNSSRLGIVASASR